MTFRRRSSSSRYTYRVTDTYFGGKTTSEGTVTGTSYFEEITDDASGSVGAWPVKACTHYKAAFTPIPGSHHATWVDGNNSIHSTEWNGYAPTAPLPDYSPFATAIAQASSSGLIPDWDRLLAASLGTLQSRQFSIINFMLELDEIPAMFLPRSYDSAFNAILAFDFGWVPLVSDLQEIYSRLNNWNRSYRRFMSRVNRPITAHYQKYGAFDGWNDGSSGQFTTQIDSASILMTVTGKYHVTWNHSPEMTGFLHALDQIGFYPDLGTVWNAIPFSFLIDWLVPVGDALSGDAWLTPSIVSFSGACYSYKIETRGKSICNWFQYGQQLFPSGLPVGKIELSYYDRRTGTPVLDGVDVPMPDWSLSPRNWRDGLSLVGSFLSGGRST